jgi:hypothetical protein
MAGLRPATFLRLYSSDKVELGVHLARLPASPLLTELVSNWLLGEVPCIIVPATAATVFLFLQGSSLTEQEET